MEINTKFKVSQNVWAVAERYRARCCKCHHMTVKEWTPVKVKITAIDITLEARRKRTIRYDTSYSTYLETNLFKTKKEAQVVANKQNKFGVI